MICRAYGDDNLASLASLARTSFASSDDAISAVLRQVTKQVGTRTSYLTRIAREAGRSAGRSEVVAAHNLPGGCGVVAGDILDLPLTF